MQSPYPTTYWCPVPPEDKTNKALCRPLPAKDKPPPPRVLPPSTFVIDGMRCLLTDSFAPSRCSCWLLSLGSGTDYACSKLATGCTISVGKGTERPNRSHQRIEQEGKAGGKEPNLPLYCYSCLTISFCMLVPHLPHLPIDDLIIFYHFVVTSTQGTSQSCRTSPPHRPPLPDLPQRPHPGDPRHPASATPVPQSIPPMPLQA